MKIAVLFHRLGPYHLARLKAVNELCSLHVIEFSSVDDTYAWDVVACETSLARTILFTDMDVERKSSFEIMTALTKAFALIQPDVVAIPGWSGRPSFLAISLCRKLRLPAIVMSASTELDQKRHWWIEWIKKHVVGNFSAGLVGGKPHAEYLYRLGMPYDRIFSGYDVVDNNHFSTGALKARKKGKHLREHYNLPEKYFLSSSRFITKKNIYRLIRAYKGYRAECDNSDVWKLVLLGDGELRPQIEDLISELDLCGEVILPGFRQYAELPIFYGLALVYVHASTTEQWGLVINEAMASGLPVLVSERCGCAPDLVENGFNGFSFNPYDIRALTQLMLKISSDECDRDSMGRASREIISRWTPEIFALRLLQAVDVALALPRPQAGLLNKTVLWALGLR